MRKLLSKFLAGIMLLGISAPSLFAQYGKVYDNLDHGQ